MPSIEYPQLSTPKWVPSIEYPQLSTLNWAPSIEYPQLSTPIRVPSIEYPQLRVLSWGYSIEGTQLRVLNWGYSVEIDSIYRIKTRGMQYSSRDTTSTGYICYIYYVHYIAYAPYVLFITYSIYCKYVYIISVYDEHIGARPPPPPQIRPATAFCLSPVCEGGSTARNEHFPSEKWNSTGFCEFLKTPQIYIITLCTGVRDPGQIIKFRITWNVHFYPAGVMHPIYYNFMAFHGNSMGSRISWIPWISWTPCISWI